MRRRVGSLARLGAGLLVLVGVPYLVNRLSEDDDDTAWAWVLAVVAALVTITLTGFLERFNRFPSGSALLHAAADDLRSLVTAQWRGSADARRIDARMPSTVERLQKASVKKGGKRVRQRSDAHATRFAEVLLSEPDQGHTVTGRAGAGKSWFLLAVMLRLLALREEGPVPVLLSLASFDPHTEDIRGWIERRLREDYPSLQRRFGRRVYADMVDAGLVLPLLDGLDEVQDDRRAGAVTSIASHVNALGTFVVASRPEGLHSAGGGGRRLLAATTQWQMQQITPTDAVRFLLAEADHLGSAEAWRRFAHEVEQHPTGPLAMSIRNPLTLALIKFQYVEGDRPVDELIAAARDGWRGVDRMLLGHYIESPYPMRAVRRRRWTLMRRGRYNPSASQVTRWMTFLASNVRDPRWSFIAWWQIPDAASPRALNTIGALSTVTIAVVTLLLAGPRSASVRDVVMIGIGVGLFGWWYSSHTLRRLWRLSTIPSPRIGRAPSPRSSIANARTRVLANLLAVAVILGTLGLLVTPNQRAVLPAAGIAFGVNLVLTGTMWGWYVLARYLLAARGHLPWRLMAFLSDAHGRGLVRQYGSVYQIRHRLLQDHLCPGAVPPPVDHDHPPEQTLIPAGRTDPGERSPDAERAY